MYMYMYSMICLHGLGAEVPLPTSDVQEISRFVDQAKEGATTRWGGAIQDVYSKRHSSILKDEEPCCWKSSYLWLAWTVGWHFFKHGVGRKGTSVSGNRKDHETSTSLWLCKCPMDPSTWIHVWFFSCNQLMFGPCRTGRNGRWLWQKQGRGFWPLQMTRFRIGWWRGKLIECGRSGKGVMAA